MALQQLPVNASQKVEKEKLRRLAAEQPELFWDREKAGIRVQR